MAVTEPTTADHGLSRAEHASAMADYVAEGKERARSIHNRGPVRRDGSGKLHPEILDAYWAHGFYVFEGVIDTEEIDELRSDAEMMLRRAPVDRRSTLDAEGNTALGRDFAIEPYLFIRPLSDPWGGTNQLAGRHPTQMTQPTPDASAPSDVVHLMFGMCQAMPAGLRLYGHPDLMTVAAGINGPDFVPYNDAIFVKQAGLGGSVSWHQDGVTHWDSPEWDEGIHGFNFQVQLYKTTAANGLWVVPGSHKLGRVDIRQLVEDNEAGERLPDAVPLLCEPGDVTIANRQILHGSFANSSPDPRISLTFGFHRLSSVLGVEGQLSLKNKQGTMGYGDVFDEQRIFERSAVIAVAIDARHQHRPTEARYQYQPFVGLEDDFRFSPETFDRVIRDYNLKDIAI